MSSLRMDYSTGAHMLMFVTLKGSGAHCKISKTEMRAGKAEKDDCF